jgi:N6-L-threonylcarbamoyladenine synthase
MLVLGIESSCDESAVALVEVREPSSSRQRIPSVTLHRHLISSQVDLHAQYGGVVPELAAREHLKNLPLLLETLFSRPHDGQRTFSLSDVSHVAVTTGPGLKGCLLMGLGVARGIALSCDIPLIGVNHLEGHLLSGAFAKPGLRFPFLCLLVSGGHSELILVRELGRYELIARTSDDAAGEAFDKSAHLLGLAYPGGPRLAALAASADLELTGVFLRKLPKVMRGQEGFSFSGLKTAIALLVKREIAAGQGTLPDAVRAALAAAIQEAIVTALVDKVASALSDTSIPGEDVSCLVVTGGVAANRTLRLRLQEAFPKLELVIPEPEFCTDNAAMIALAGVARVVLGEQGSYAPAVRSRWPVEELR